MEAITEKDVEIIEQWYKDAPKQTIETLSEFMSHVLNDYYHDDYGTICKAIGACAIAAAWAANASPGSRGGITGFQAGAVMWEFIRHWNRTNNKTGMCPIDYDDMLYPQYENRFSKTITNDLMESLVKEAKKHIAEYESNPKSMVHPDVLAHWKKIAQGIPPFGYKVVDEKF